mgnify:CR=1 FL=1
MKRSIVVVAFTADSSALKLGCVRRRRRCVFAERSRADFGQELPGALCRRDLQLRFPVPPASAARSGHHTSSPASSTSIPAMSMELKGTPLVTKRWIPVAGSGIDSLRYSFKARICVTRLSLGGHRRQYAATQCCRFYREHGNDPGVNGKLCQAGFPRCLFPPRRVTRAGHAPPRVHDRSLAPPRYRLHFAGGAAIAGLRPASPPVRRETTRRPMNGVVVCRQS